MKWYHNQFEFKKDKGVTWIDFENSIEFARLVASMKDVYKRQSFNMAKLAPSNPHVRFSGSIIYTNGIRAKKSVYFIVMMQPQTFCYIDVYKRQRFLLKEDQSAAPCAAQLFGHDPELLASAAASEALKLSLIHILTDNTGGYNVHDYKSARFCA